MAKRRPPSSPSSTELRAGAKVIHLPWPDVLSDQQVEDIMLAPIIEALEPPVRGMKPRLVEARPAPVSTSETDVAPPAPEDEE